MERVLALKVLVTGGAGFIGSHTVDKLLDTGAEVLVVDDLSTGKRENLNPHAGFVRMDICSRYLSEEFNRFKPDFVVHLAAQVSVTRAVDDPVKDSMTNVVGTVNLLKNCLLHNVKRVVYASSAAVYGNPGVDLITEGTATVPLSFYGVSKLTPEYYLRVFSHLYGLHYTVLRYANVYGPRQDARGEAGVVSIFASKAASGENPVIFGDGEQTRDFIFVGDVAAANIMAIHAGDRATLNIGTGKGTSINKLLTMICEITGVNLEPVFVEARDSDIRHSRMDITNTLACTDWRPQMTLKEGLTRTLEHYRTK